MAKVTRKEYKIVEITEKVVECPFQLHIDGVEHSRHETEAQLLARMFILLSNELASKV